MARKAIPERMLIPIATLLSGHGVTALLTLARNLAIASLLGPESYGLAVAIVVIAAAAEMGTTLGLPQQIVSSRNGATTKFQAALHTLQLVRGGVGAGFVLLCAGPLAHALSAPDATQLFQTVAIVPAISGLTHLDQFRAQRHQEHGPVALGLAIPAFAATAALWPLSHWVAGPELMLAVLVLQATAGVLVSYAVARRPYRLGLTRPTMQQALRFGLPLMANGTLMFTTLHAEKLVAGTSLGVADMGLLAMGFTLTTTPALIVARSFQAYHLPRLKHGADAQVIFGTACAVGATLAAGLAVFVPHVLPHLPTHFWALNEVTPLLSSLAGLRIAKSALATRALADHRTARPALANLPRLIALPLVWVMLAQGGGLDALLRISILAELAGIALGWQLARGTRLPLRELTTTAVVALLIFAGQPAIALVVCGLVLAVRTAGPTARAQRAVP